MKSRLARSRAAGQKNCRKSGNNILDSPDWICEYRVMSKKNSFPETLHEAVKYFAVERNALDFMKLIRWPDGVVKCPTCGSTDVSFLATRKVWKCKKVHPK